MAELKAALFLAKGFEEIEAVSIVDILRRGGMDISMVSVAGNEQVEGAHGIVVTADYNFYEVDYSKYDMLILPGGMPGTTNLGAHEDLCELIVSFHDDGKWLAAICAGPSVYGKLGILAGEEATCFPGFEKYLEGAKLSELDVVVSNHFITGKGPGLSMKFGLTILEQFMTLAEVEQLRKSMFIGKYS
ncbi:MAG: DJ-1/PfpI family protein [Vallitaleaceae bacterium]|jgi:4-methyl-5(b-hydroxyethyl)-thiazole monophosphate biosynthesis|nr:DJ-1/PfpI family protein [Vallitaleaceae bacterium]